MSEHPQDHLARALQLMAELDRLMDEQRQQDLRDPEAMDKYQQKIDALRQKLEWLKTQGRDSVKHAATWGESPPWTRS